MTALRTKLAEGALVRAASAWDGLSAFAAREAGCGGLVVSGASVAASRHALPDLGFVTADDMIAVTRTVVDASGLPTLVDIDTGFGNAATAVRAAEQLAHVGAAGVIVEDQISPKRCGNMSKGVVHVDVAAEVVRELARHRPSEDFVIVARTDAKSVNGLADAVARTRRYVTEGADVWYIQGATSTGELELLAAELSGPSHQVVTAENAAMDDPRWSELGVGWLTHAAVAESAMVAGVTSALRQSLLLRPVDTPVDALALAKAFAARRWMEIGWQ